MCDTKIGITFVVPCNDKKLTNSNFMASPLLLNDKNYEIKLMWGYNSASEAYNIAIKEAKNDLIIFSHQDVLLPKNWDLSLLESINYLKENSLNWGVLGCYGVTSQGLKKGFIYCNANGGYIGEPFMAPQPVQTLDEINLIIRKSSGLRFDEKLKGYHLYGTDICLAAKEEGLNAYVIPALCLHNSTQTLIYPKEFFECCDYIRIKWPKYIPIHTTCITIENSKLKFDIKYRLRNYISHIRHNIIGLKEKARTRSENPLIVLNQMVSDK